MELKIYVLGDGKYLYRLAAPFVGAVFAGKGLEHQVGLPAHMGQARVMFTHGAPALDVTSICEAAYLRSKMLRDNHNANTRAYFDATRTGSNPNLTIPSRELLQKELKKMRKALGDQINEQVNGYLASFQQESFQ